MSFEEDEVSIAEEPILPPEPTPEKKPQIIDIDEGSASGKLSALRMEMETDDKNPSKKVDNISSRLDSFLKDR
jgi:hypothetical protein